MQIGLLKIWMCALSVCDQAGLGGLVYDKDLPESYPFPMKSMLKDVASICSWVGPSFEKTPQENNSGKLSRSCLPRLQAANVEKMKLRSPSSNRYHWLLTHNDAAKWTVSSPRLPILFCVLLTTEASEPEINQSTALVSGYTTLNALIYCMELLSTRTIRMKASLKPV